MKLIIGLGNPEEKYTDTRHNVGFQALDESAKKHDVVFKLKDKFRASIAETKIDGQKVIFAKPTTYYNLTGEAYLLLTDFYKIDPADVLVVHDELALPFSTIRTRIGGSDAGNNGIKSINQRGGKESARLRVGISNEQRTNIEDTAFVLGRFTIDEQTQLTKSLLPKITTLIDQFISGSFVVTSDSPKPDLA